MKIHVDKGGINILYAEDEHGLRSLVSKELLSQGYNVTTVASGNLAIGELRTASFDLIILDLMMQDGDGFDVLKYLEQEQSTIPVIVLSGYADRQNVLETHRLGAKRVMAKPCDLETLFQGIYELTNSALAMN